MRNLYAWICSKNALKVMSLLFVLVWAILLVINYSKATLTPGNNDDYFGHFEEYKTLGFYEASIKGTSAVYNIALSVVDTITNDTPTTFFALNLMVLLLLVWIGLSFLRKYVEQKDQPLSTLTIIVFGLALLDLRSFMKASNDSFLGVFVLLSLFLVFRILIKRKEQGYNFVILGFLLGLSTGIRATALFLILMTGVAFITYLLRKEEGILLRFKKTILLGIIMVLTIAALHYPSLSQNGSLSFRDKNPVNSEVNWIQRNYLGLKKIQQGKEKLNRAAIWQNTKFEVVEVYVKEHGPDSLPKSYGEVLQRDPWLLTQITAYNIGFVFLRFIRFYGLLIFIPLLYLFRRPLKDKKKLPLVLFAIFTMAISTVCFTFIEMRWFIGFEILVPLGILLTLSKTQEKIGIERLRLLFSLSFLVVTLFNIKSILAII